ncbi:MAG: hypothetical protein LC685_04215 [Actinobacteria bacterium]|nr:hypothetical protein [Actinomycetota bacterium]
MAETIASRTLVKSPPELWEVCSDAALLGRHLGPFGEIRITRLEPETTVAWEGERASGTVRIEASGWGTRVILTAAAVDGRLEPEAPPQEPPASRAPSQAARRRRAGLLSRLARALFDSAVAPVAVPADDQPTESAASPWRAHSPGPARSPGPAVSGEPAPVASPAAYTETGPTRAGVLDALAALDAALDSLGQDHHRPFSRG